MGDTTDHNAYELQKQVALGDEQAFKALFDRYHHRLYQYIFKMVKSKNVAEELVMDVFLKLWLGRDLLADIENLDGFLFKVAYNKSIDFFRAAAKDKQLGSLLYDQIEIPSQSQTDSRLLLQEYEKKIREAIDLLPPQRRKIFQLSREEGLTHARIAEELGISKNTVANTIVEARQFIKSYLSANLPMAILLAAIAQVLKK